MGCAFQFAIPGCSVSARRIFQRLSLCGIEYFPSLCLLFLHSLYHCSDALAYADAHSGEAVATAAPLQFVEQGGDDARATTAQGMTEGDGAAVDVEFFLVDLQFADTLERLGGEGFVDLDQVKVVDAQTGSLENLARGRDGSQAHVGGIDARDCAGDDARAGTQAKLAGGAGGEP